MNKKILYFDYWTVGINNFRFFDQELKSKGFETKLLHLNSWKGIDGPDEQVIEGIGCYDIRYYKTNFLYDVISQEMPLAVVLLNSSFITDRTIILCCKKLGVKTIYLMHGSLVREEFIDESIKSINQSIAIRHRITKGIKHIKGTIANYLKAIIKYDSKYLFRIHAYKVIFKTFSDPGTYLHFPPQSFDLSPDLALVYGSLDFDFYKKKFDRTTVIKIVGNPDLDIFFIEKDTLSEDKEAFYNLYNLPIDKPYVTYIDEGLVEDNIWEPNQRIKFFKEINDLCIAAGLYLVIKLHPRTARGLYRQTFDVLENVTILDKVNFPKLMNFTEKCISHYSTTLIYPMLLNKPILIPRWGKSANLITLYSKDEVTFVRTIDAFKKEISHRHFKYERANYLDKYVPFTDGRTKHRIADYIVEMCQ